MNYPKWNFILILITWLVVIPTLGMVINMMLDLNSVQDDVKEIKTAVVTP